MLATERMIGGLRKAPWAIQRVLVSKDETVERANEMANHVLNKKIKGIPIGNFFHFRNIPKTAFVKGTFRTKQIKAGLKLVFGELKPEHTHLSGAGFFDFFKRGYEYIKEKVSPVTAVVSNAVDTVKEKVSSALTIKEYSKNTTANLAKYGSQRVTGLTIYRKPVEDWINKVFQGVSVGQWETLKKKYGIDKFFHLTLVCTVDGDKKVAVEKLEVISVNENVPSGEGVETHEVPLKGKSFTISNTLELARAKVGDATFFSYDALGGNNCQNFVALLLEVQGLYGPSEKAFVYQDIKSLVAELPPRLLTFSKATTDLGALFNKATGIGGGRSVGGVRNRLPVAWARWRLAHAQHPLRDDAEFKDGFSEGYRRVPYDSFVDDTDDNENPSAYNRGYYIGNREGERDDEEDGEDEDNNVGRGRGAGDDKNFLNSNQIINIINKLSGLTHRVDNIENALKGGMSGGSVGWTPDGYKDQTDLERGVKFAYEKTANLLDPDREGLENDKFVQQQRTRNQAEFDRHKNAYSKEDRDRLSDLQALELRGVLPERTQATKDIAALKQKYKGGYMRAVPFTNRYEDYQGGRKVGGADAPQHPPPEIQYEFLSNTRTPEGMSLDLFINDEPEPMYIDFKDGVEGFYIQIRDKFANFPHFNWHRFAQQMRPELLHYLPKEGGMLSQPRRSVSPIRVEQDMVREPAPLPPVPLREIIERMRAIQPSLAEAVVDFICDEGCPITEMCREPRLDGDGKGDLLATIVRLAARINRFPKNDLLAELDNLGIDRNYISSRFNQMREGNLKEEEVNKFIEVLNTIIERFEPKRGGNKASGFIRAIMAGKPVSHPEQFTNYNTTGFDAQRLSKITKEGAERQRQAEPTVRFEPQEIKVVGEHKDTAKNRLSKRVGKPKTNNTIGTYIPVAVAPARTLDQLSEAYYAAVNQAGRDKIKTEMEALGTQQQIKASLAKIRKRLQRVRDVNAGLDRGANR